MGKVQVFIGSLFISLAMTDAVLAADLGSTPSSNCFITTTTEYKDGDTQTMTQAFLFKTKKECERTKKTLSQNFDPSRIKKVTAKAEWRGK